MCRNTELEDTGVTLEANFKLFNDICMSITKLSKSKYAELRQWLLLQPTVEDWQKLMKS